jgi:N-acetylated-alpha-linked acidic dipeptidase
MKALHFTFVLALPAFSALSYGQTEPARGFTAKSSVEERALESRFDSYLTKTEPREWLKRMSAKPHQVGSAYGLENANFALALFKSWGFDAQIEEFKVLFPSPKERLLELEGPHKFKAKLSEPELKEDSTSKPTVEQLPSYNAYSADGDVRGQLVYANYGMPKDYEVLESKGIDVKGKIVIARYGGGWRGLKPKLAAEHGAVGCLIYSDPHDDGYFQGDVYPKGAFRNENGVQRGSVADMVIYPGDPLTPGVGATADAKRLTRAEAVTLMKIPVQPISYGDALPLLKDLQGQVVPDAWRGALPITYHFGPSTNMCHLKLAFNWDMVSCRDVVAKLPGSTFPDQWVIRGNHYDGWVTGAQDPLSGSVALLEEAKCIGMLAKTGWRPKRTMIYCLWDGEEPGLLGSTEWVETHADELSQKAVSYINSDENGRGFLGMEGSHSLESLINEVSREVPDPEKGVSVGERARDQKIVGATGEARAKIRAAKDLEIGALGSGSDFSPFLQHLGIAALNLGFGGENPGGIYHSAYDSFDWFTRFDDGTFDYSNALSKTAGRAMLRLANADVLPYEFGHLSDRISDYVTELVKLNDTMRQETIEENRLLAEGTLTATYDPQKPTIAPKPKGDVPHLNFAPLENAIDHLKKSAAEYDAAYKKALAGPSDHSAVNTDLLATERVLLSPSGLPKRGWYRHMLYAPGLTTGYGVKTLPGVREAMEDRKWDEAQVQIGILAPILEKLAGHISDAAKKLG